MRKPALYCYSCGPGVVVREPRPARCRVCGGQAFYRKTHPRTQTTGALVDRLPWEEVVERPPAEVSYGTPVRKRGPWGHGP